MLAALLPTLLHFGAPGECANAHSKVRELQAELDKAKAELRALRAFPDCQRVAYALGCDDVPPPGTAGFSAGDAAAGSNGDSSEPYDRNFKKIKIRAEYGKAVANFDYSRRVQPDLASNYFPDFPPAKKLGRATGYMTVRKMLDEYEWNSVADIGSGAGGYSKLFHHLNKSVTSYELGRRYSSSNVSDFTSRELKPGHELAYRAAVTNDGGAPWRILMGNFMCSATEVYDALWVHHVTEHILDPHVFMVKLHSMLKEGGILALTVPPLKSQIVGGHVSVWLGGLLIQHLVRAGFDCKYMRLFKQSYSIGVLLKKRTITETIKWRHDRGDICQLMKPYLPIGLKRSAGLKPADRKPGDDCMDAFEGNLLSLNWD